MDDFTEDCDCGGTFRFSLSDVAQQRTVRCSRGCNVQLIDQGGGARGAENALAELDGSLSKLSRTIKL